MSLADYTDEELLREIERRRSSRSYDTIDTHRGRDHRLIYQGDETFHFRAGCAACNVWLEPVRLRKRKLTDAELKQEKTLLGIP